MEKEILAAFIADRASMESLCNIISVDDFSAPAAVIYKYIDKFYDKDEEAYSIDISVLKSAIGRKFPHMKDNLMEFIDELDVQSVPNLVAEVVALKKERIGMQLSSALMNNSENIPSLIERYSDIENVEADGLGDDSSYVFHKAELEEIFADTSISERIPLYPSALNNAVGGGVLRGHHIVLFAMPEAGKSLVSIAISANLCNEGYRVLYIGNEEPRVDLLVRFVANMSDMSCSRVRSNPRRAQDRAETKGYENLVVAELSPGTFQEIESLILRYKPDVMVVDQMRKLNTGEDNELSSISKASGFIRKMGKKHNMVAISVTQAGESATNKLMLEMGDVYMSNTSVPGDADLMIGMGTNYNFESMNKLMVNLPKNKINGKHTSFSIRIDPNKTQVKSIDK